MSPSFPHGWCGRRPALFLAISTLVGFTACADNTFQVQGRAPSNAPAQSSYPYQYLPEAPVLNLAGLQDFVGRFRHHVILVDVWASWSQRCRSEMSALAKIRSELEEAGFYVVSINLDSPDRWKSQTVPLLHAANANYPCVVAAPEAKPDLRLWLAPDWDLDLPARFLIGRRGEILAQMLADTPLSVVEQRCLDAVRGGPVAATPVRHDGVSLRAKIIDVSAGRAVAIPEIIVESPDPGLLAARITPQVLRHLGPEKTQRIAILPFASSEDRAHPGPLGRQTAAVIGDQLRQAGHYDLLVGHDAEQMISELGLTPMTIDFEPALIKGRGTASFVVLGWLRDGTVDARPGLAGRRQEASERPPILAGSADGDEAP